MKLKEFKILLDIKNNNYKSDIQVVQGDTDTNILYIQLMDSEYEYDLKDLDVEVIYSKPDGTIVLQNTENGLEISGNKIKVNLKTNTIAVPGLVYSEVRLIKDKKILTSSKFKFHVRKALFSDEAIESTNEFPLLQQLTDNVQGIIATESARVTSENTRKTNETNRVTEEEKRVTAEQNRATIFAGYENRVSTVEQDLVAHKEDYANQQAYFNLYFKNELENAVFKNDLISPFIPLYANKMVVYKGELTFEAGNKGTSGVYVATKLIAGRKYAIGVRHKSSVNHKLRIGLGTTIKYVTTNQYHNYAFAVISSPSDNPSLTLYFSSDELDNTALLLSAPYVIDVTEMGLSDSELSGIFWGLGKTYVETNIIPANNVFKMQSKQIKSLQNAITELGGTI